uniref:Serine/threonine-protein kinase RIO3 n=1 Tax=Hadrurus spadix TaxID=141984 RepID=A0A1W7R9K7_9SCOR
MESTEIELPPSLPSLDRPSLPVIPSQTAAVKACPWGKVPPPPVTVSFVDVMSEQLIHSLKEEDDKAIKAHEKQIEDHCELLTEDTDCSSDLFLAQLLQREYDLEHDAMLAAQERKYNAGSKVSVSFNKYRCVPSNMLSDDDDLDDDQDDPKRHQDLFERAEKMSPTIGKNGISRKGNVITTKHDSVICGRRNAHRLMEFPPGIVTGDGGGFDMKLSNNVYNKLKTHSMNEARRSHRVHEKKDKSTAEQAVDEKTRLILYKFIEQGLLESINGCISTGKESCIFHALGGQNDKNSVPKECAIKVFKTTLNEFKNRDQYIKDDYRFKDRFDKQNPRKVIHMWSEKEMHNLQRMRRAGLLCPEVVALRKHALVMSFIGNNGTPAPKLKEAKLSIHDLSDAYVQTVEIMKRMYKCCRLVHADLSQYNLLWHNGQVWVIDVSQSVEPNHPQGLEFLYRDCRNITEYFKRQFLPDVMTAEALFKEVSDITLPGEGLELISQIQGYERKRKWETEKSADMDSFEALYNHVKDQQKVANKDTHLSNCTGGTDAE